MENYRHSPIFLSAIEDFNHALEHLKIGEEIDNKYAVIHAATAIELLLKEKIRSLEVSIFKKKPPYRSLSFHECVNLLQEKGVPIPKLSDIELIHEERNLYIHLGAKPDKERTQWLLSTSHNFMKEFCRKAMDIDLNYYLPGHVPPEIEIFAARMHSRPSNVYLVDARTAFNDGKYYETIFNSSVAIELLFRDYMKSQKLKIGHTFHETLTQIFPKKWMPPVPTGQLLKIQEIRNKIIRHLILPSKRDAESALNLLEVTFSHFEKLWRKQKRCDVCGNKNIAWQELEILGGTILLREIEKSDSSIKPFKKTGDIRILNYYCKKHKPYWGR